MSKRRAPKGASRISHFASKRKKAEGVGILHGRKPKKMSHKRGHKRSYK